MEGNNPSPEPKAWLLSSIYYSWANKLFSSTQTRNKNGEELENEDLFDLPPGEKTAFLTINFEKRWYAFMNRTSPEEMNQRKAKTEFKWALWGVVRKPMIMGGLFRLLNSIIQLSIPFVIEQVLIVVEDIDNTPLYEGFFWAVMLGIVALLKAMIESRFFWLVQRGGWQARSVISTAVYRKSLRLSASSRQFLSQGQIVNLMQLDAEKLERHALNFHVPWDSLFQLFGYCSILYYYIQEGVFVGLTVVVITLPMQICLIAKLFGYVKQIAVATDQRVKVTNEALQSMSAVKSGAWEYSFGDRLIEIRNRELLPLKHSLLLRSGLMAYITTVPVLTAVVALSYYGLRNKDDINAATLFAALQAFQSLRYPLMQLPMAISTFTDAKVSQMRLARFFSLEETNASHEQNEDEVKDGFEKSRSVDKNVTAQLADQDNIEGAQEAEIQDNVVIEIKDGEFFWTEGAVKEGEMFSILNPKNKKKSKTSKKKSPLPQTAIETETDPISNGTATPVSVEVSESTPRPALEDINLVVRKGDLVGVVGSVGSGKSTLLSSILGELIQTKGTAAVKGSVAYCCQTAWIQNATLRDNVIFGLEFDQARYDKVLKACQLLNDLELLQEGDKTMIGERGINLSGGQAQRVSVARALYSTAQVVLLDDPLSALDPEVARKLFQECVDGMLKEEGRTVVMVTNQLHFLETCDYVVFLKENKNEKSGNSRIEEQGTFASLMESESDFAKLVKSFQGENEKKKQPENDNIEALVEAEVKEKKEKDDGKLMQTEERQKGAVKFKYYWKYIKAGGRCYFLIAVILLIFALITALGNTFVVSFWADDPLYEKFTIDFYLAAYAISAVVMGVFYFLQTFFFYYCSLRASRKVHSELVTGVFMAPMSFFDTTPTGRIVSRFSKDLFSLDNELPPNIMFFTFTFGMMITSVGAVISQILEFAIAIPFMVFAYLYVMRSYRPTARDVKRLESLSRSPVYAHFSETLGGLSSIRAFGKVNEFMNTSQKLVDASLKTTYAVRVVERWLAVRLDSLSATVTLLAAALVIYAAAYQNLSAGFAGVVLSMVISFSNLISGVVRTFVIIETNMNALERVDHYAHEIEKEAPFQLPNEQLDNNWPSKGQIVLENVSMRYREETPIVLNGVNVRIEGGSTVGIVGRTGCGKSSLMLTLLRIVELETGKITIDGVDVSTLGLHALRRKVSIVPQNPVMFSGTVKSNLDPFSNSSDDQLWAALRQVNLGDYVKGLPNQLESEVAEYGENFSQGQRQLICMARSLLENAKILLLDEATSSVDYETDAIIQTTIRESFSHCTILTIAHRIQTVADYDNILVMQEGKVAEYDSPANLLANPNSEFSGILSEMGAKMEARIRQLVLEKTKG